VYALCGDGNTHIYSAGGDGMVVQWDLEKPKDGVSIAKLDTSVYALAYDARGFLVIGANYNGLHLVDISSKETLFSIQLPNCGMIFDLLIDGDLIYVACQKGLFFEVSILNRTVKHRTLGKENLRSIAKTENGFAVAASDGKVLFYTAQFDLKHTISDAKKSIFKLYLSDNQLFTVSIDCHLRIYKEAVLSQDLVAHMYAINHIDFHPHKQYFATASQDKTIKIWDKNTFALLKVIDFTRYNGHQNSVNKLFWSRYNNLLVSCSDDRSLKVWQINFDTIDTEN
jgi:WD40 repeat protein